MSQTRVETKLHDRRLSAILAADVAGYSRLMGADEEGTLEALKAHRKAVVDPAIANHRGRIVKTTGDGMLVEFASAVDAVRCAVDVQRSMAERNEAVPPERRIVFRMGINVGDIIGDGSDIYGDGVNVAARLESMAEPGGIWVSQAVRDPVRDKLSFSFQDLGRISAKNISRPIHVFRVRHDTEAKRSKLTVPSATRRLVIAAVAALAVLGAGAGAWHWREHILANAPATAPRPVAFSPQDRRLSVIVLPFENSSGDPRQDDLAAGITRDVTDRFARAGIPVIAEATAASYRGKTVNLQTLGRDYNVHFALTGNARRQDAHLIVSATLYEADSNKTLWSQRFDRPDNGDEWNGIIAQISNHFSQAAIDAEVARAMREHPDNLDKRDLMFAYDASSLSTPTKENHLKEIALIERALAIDPDYVHALVEKAQTYTLLVLDGYSSDPSADLSAARKAVDRALQLAPDDIWALRRKATILQAQGDLEGADALVRTSLEREPLDGYRYRQLGQIQMMQGHFKEALQSFTTANRLGGSPPLPVFSQSLALGLLANDRFPEAIAEARQARAGWQTRNGVGRLSEGSWLTLIAAESDNGQDAEARADLQKFLATPRTYRTLAEVQKSPDYAANRNLLDGLQRAGMPAE
jgi:class 3 adenylate cyclase/TolB-like protein